MIWLILNLGFYAKPPSSLKTSESFLLMAWRGSIKTNTSIRAAIAASRDKRDVNRMTSQSEGIKLTRSYRFLIDD